MLRLVSLFIFLAIGFGTFNASGVCLPILRAMTEEERVLTGLRYFLREQPWLKDSAEQIYWLGKPPPIQPFREFGSAEELLGAFPNCCTEWNRVGEQYVQNIFAGFRTVVRITIHEGMLVAPTLNSDPVLSDRRLKFIGWESIVMDACGRRL